MKLYTSVTSPFGRKCNMVAHVVGVIDQIELVDPDYKNPEYLNINPLAKVPALERDDGRVLLDSPVISAYLASLGDTEKTHPQNGDAKWDALHLEALADGVMDAGILVFMESFRSEKRQSKGWIDKQLGKMNAGLDVIEGLAADFGEDTNIGILSTAAALSWFEMRSVGEDWRKGRPYLTSWMDRFSQNDFFKETGCD